MIIVRRTSVESFVQVFPFPKESPDLNSIEEVWQDLKTFVNETVQPQTVHEMEEGVKRFWVEKMDVAKCRSYIARMGLKIERVIRAEGGPTTDYD